MPGQILRRLVSDIHKTISEHAELNGQNPEQTASNNPRVHALSRLAFNLLKLPNDHTDLVALASTWKQYQYADVDTLRPVEIALDRIGAYGQSSSDDGEACRFLNGLHAALLDDLG